MLSASFGKLHVVVSNLDRARGVHGYSWWFEIREGVVDYKSPVIDCGAEFSTAGAALKAALVPLRERLGLPAKEMKPQSKYDHTDRVNIAGTRLGRDLSGSRREYSWFLKGPKGYYNAEVEKVTQGFSLWNVDIQERRGQDKFIFHGQFSSKVFAMIALELQMRERNLVVKEVA